MPFCHAPWTNLDISPQGHILPCCKFQIGSNDQQFNIQQDSLDSYVRSAFLAKIKQDFLNDQWPTGCVRCQNEEQNNIKSKRQLDHERWAEHYAQYQIDSDQWITASIAFGNTCNLKCITCNSETSSRWHAEYKKIYNVHGNHVKFYREDFVETLVNQAPGVIHLDIHGGEPLLTGVQQQKKLLQHYIDSGQATDISLHYTTNVTVFPDSDWWQLWRHFKEIDLQLSIDGIEQRYEYIRYPAVWVDTVTNTERYIQKEKELANIRLSVSHTVSAYNIFYLDEFFAWCNNIGLPRPWLGSVHNPAHFRPTVWPDHVRNLIQQHLNCSKYDDVHVWAQAVVNADDYEYFDQFCKRLREHDQYRGLVFENTFPEMATFIND